MPSLMMPIRIRRAENNDKKILSFKKNADWYKEYPDVENLTIFVAQEGMEIEV